MVDLPVEGYTIENFNPRFKVNKKLKKITVYLEHVPNDVEVFTEALMWALNHAGQVPELAAAIHSDKKEARTLALLTEKIAIDPEIAENYRVYVTGMAMARVAEFELESGDKMNDLDWNLYALGDDRTRPIPLDNMGPTLKDIIANWLAENEKAMSESLATASDAYGEIVEFTSVTVSFKLIEHKGRGYMEFRGDSALKELIFSPVCEADCFFLCLQNAGMKYSTSLRDLKNKLKIGSAVNLREIGACLALMTPPTQVIVHKPLTGTDRFSTTIATCTRIPHTKGNMGQVHLGLVGGHYFLIKDVSCLATLAPTMFWNVCTSNDEYLVKNATGRGELKVTEKVKGTHGVLWKDKSVVNEGKCVVELKSIKKRITGYKDQDLNAGRDSLDPAFVTEEQVQAILTGGRCHYCNEEVKLCNWTLDRKDSSLPHTFQNVVLACKRCNCKKRNIPYFEFKETVNRTCYFWDCETYREEKIIQHRLHNSKGGEEMYREQKVSQHVVYNVGVLKGASKDHQRRQKNNGVRGF